jgi:hypothetical protein
MENFVDLWKALKEADESEQENLVIPSGTETVSTKMIPNKSVLKSVTVPEGVREIGPFAFKGCVNLEKVVLPKSIEKIDIKAFDGCDKVTIHIPREAKVKAYPSDVEFLKKHVKYK